MTFRYRLRAVPPVKTEAEAQRELAELRRAAKRRDYERTEKRRKAREGALAIAQAEHEAEFSRPLISAKLLTAEERWQHRFKAVGVQRWRPMGGAI